MCNYFDAENVVIEEIEDQNDSVDIGEVISTGIEVVEAIGSIFGANGEDEPEDTPNDSPYSVTLVIDPEDKSEGDDISGNEE